MAEGHYPIDGRLSDGVHERPVRIYFEDTDFSGVVYHAAYLKFMERGRSDFLRCLKLSHAVLSDKGMAFGVAHMDIRFLAGAGIDDLLSVRTKLIQSSGVRLVFEQVVQRQSIPLVIATVTVALIKDGKPQRLPADMQTLFRDISKSS
ncbi:YbgC/FadM family acyl-CoA thioesterase [Pararhizobium sp. IMCC21322]|uniref:YbgC/FadM family acyl-CoA thioesterase n=1 Tax=Pararhizobium sp. IMCC21322 TaxID=3067903 RepID=UPI0027410506|nr:YbgC/FadM family acyl-CoA thioesterase [Pararhizobium sp. IMCC21322]